MDISSTLYGQLEFLQIFLNPFILLMISIPATILIGLLLGMWLSQPRKPRIIKLSPESGRGADYEVDSEDTINAYCKPIENEPPQRFIKLFHAFTIVRKGWFKLYNYALWIGRQGTAYTVSLSEGKEVKVPLREAIKNLFGQELYDRIPNEQKTGYIKDKIEKSEVNVVIELAASEPLTPLNPYYDPNITDEKDPRSKKYLPSVSSDDIRRNAIDTLIESVVRGVQRLAKMGGSGEWIKIIFCVGTGVAIGIVLSLVFHWGGTTVIEPATTKAVLSWLGRFI